MTRRTLHDALLRRLTGRRQFLQVLAGPRQVGKTTLAQQVMRARKKPAHEYPPPDHHPVKCGTLSSSLKSVAQHHRLTIEERLSLLRL